MIGVSFNKFGYVENGEIDLNKLTILTGEIIPEKHMLVMLFMV